VPGTDWSAGFRRLYDAHRDVIFAYLLSSTGDREESLDLLQETFVRAWSRLDQVVELEVGQQRAWLRSVARNAAIDGHRRRSRRPAVSLEWGPEPRSDGPGPEQSAETSDELAAVGSAIARLPESLREPLLLSTIGGLTSAAIGQTLGLPAGTVRYRILRARTELAKSLAPEWLKRLSC
jgi:RNA polymerase sigma-70 factor, ECF subfamily